MILAAVMVGQGTQANPGKGEDLRSIISDWVDTMHKSTEAEARWARDEVVLKANLEGLRAELSQIRSETKVVQNRLNSAGKVSVEKLEQKEEFDAARKALEEGLVPLEKEALDAVPLVPEFFRAESQKLSTAIETLEKQERRMKNPDDGKKPVTLNGRLSAVVTFLTEMERFNQARWIKDISQEVDGKEMSLKAVYFGLGAAYASNKSGSVAMVGRPGLEGWVFERILDPDHAMNAKTLIDVATESGVTEIVALPIQISE